MTAAPPTLPLAAVPPSPASSAPDFVQLGLSPSLVKTAAALGWHSATAIQATTLAAAIQHRDVLGLAPTGSGKTGAFLLPLLQNLLAAAATLEERPRRLRALILAPTRELASQIGATATALAPQLKTAVAVGGAAINPQMMALRGGAHVVVATPGRLLDLLDHNALRLTELEVLVLDEADRLLDLGFAEEIGRVLEQCPQQRQTLMFSATMPAEVAALADRSLRDAVRADVRTASDAAAPAIEQRAIEVDSSQRTALLRHLISHSGWDRTLVFVATQYASERVADKLRRAGIKAAALHGQLSQGRRSQALTELQRGSLTVLVATDLAARGLDVAGLAAVVNYDLPRSTIDYTHRIGRTGRAGAAGVALSFITADAPGSEAHFRLIEKRQQQRVAREQVAGFEPSAAPAAGITASDPSGGLKGRRKSKKDKLREAAAR